jgi:hypothetical protein
MTYGQAGAVCPQCGSAAAVHSIAEWAAMAQGRTGGPGQAYGPTPQTGFPNPSQYQQSGTPDPAQSQQSGFPDPSQYQQQQSGFPDPSQYQQSGFPDPSPYQQPGFPDPAQYQQQPGFPHPTPEPPPGRPSEAWQEDQPPPRRRSSNWDIIRDGSSIEDVVGEAVLGAATKALGRAFGRKMRQAYNERVVPAMAARQEAMLNDRMVIAQRHPDLCACLNDQVVFLVGGTRTLPLASAMQVRTVEQSDALVAQLRG